jgi:hypothetical protein
MEVTQGLRESRKKGLPAAGVQGVFSSGCARAGGHLQFSG